MWPNKWSMCIRRIWIKFAIDKVVVMSPYLCDKITCLIYEWRVTIRNFMWNTSRTSIYRHPCTVCNTQASPKCLVLMYGEKLSGWKDWAGEKKIPTKFGPFGVQINRNVLTIFGWESATKSFHQNYSETKNHCAMKRFIFFI